MAQEEGYLSYFLLVVCLPFHYPGYLFSPPQLTLVSQTSVLATIHSAVCYVSPAASLKPFSGPRHPPHTPLLAHVYGITNILMGAIRAQAAYDITNKVGCENGPFSVLISLTLTPLSGPVSSGTRHICGRVMAAGERDGRVEDGADHGHHTAIRGDGRGGGMDGCTEGMVRWLGSAHRSS